MQNFKFKKYYFGSLVVLFILAFDQFTKQFISKSFELYSSKEIIKDFFSLTYTHNDGAGFSILQGQLLFFIVITVVALIVFITLYLKENEKILRISYLFIIGGTLGNFIDRVLYGYVIDFLHFQFFGYHYPIFNVADIFITIGATILIIYYLFKRGKNE